MSLTEVIHERIILLSKWIVSQWSTSQLASTIALLVSAYLLWHLVKILREELRIRYWFKRLPGMGYIGIAGWVLGNADVYYYYLSHIDRKKVVTQLLEGMCVLGNSREQGISRIEMGFQRVVALWTADTIEELVTSVTNIEKSEQYRFFEPWLGTGLLTSTGEKWKVNRKRLTPAFHFNILQSFLPIMNENIAIMLQRIAKASHAKSGIDVRSFITDMTLDTICQTAMGVSVGAQAEQTNVEYVKPLNTVLQMVMNRILDPIMHPDFIYNNTPSGRVSRENLSTIHGFISKVINNRREELEKSIRENQLDINKLGSAEVETFTKKRYAFLDSLLVAHFQNPNEFTESDIHDQVNTFMFGGHDTSSVALIYAMLLIGNDLRVQNKIFDELQSIYGSDMDRPIRSEDCRDMKYLEMCIKEVLRIYPPAPFLGRKIKQDFTVRGHRIPAGCTCAIFMYLLHRNPKVFPQPEKFIPERFEPDRPIHKMPYAYMPFSAGPRNCIGQKFAMLEMKIVLASILQRFRIDAITKRDHVEVEFSILLKPTSPVVIRFEKRQNTTK